MNKRMIEFDIRANRLENHCFTKQEPILIQVNQRFNDLKTEMYYRIENFANIIAEVKEQLEGFQTKIDLFSVTMSD